MRDRAWLSSVPPPVVEEIFFSDAVRSISDDAGVEWYFLCDVVKVMTRSATYCAIRSIRLLPKPWVKRKQFFIRGRNRNIVLVRREAIFQLLFRSRLPEGVAFSQWFCSAVMPKLPTDWLKGSG